VDCKDQYLEQVDEQTAEVYYSDGHPAFGIEAIPAHDADGTTVPTSLAVSGPDVITLRVHFRPDDPAAVGGPFDYPVIAGAGWEGGFSPVEIVLSSPDESELKAKAGMKTAASGSGSQKGRLLPADAEVERLVKRNDHAVAVDCRRLRARKTGVGRWHCDVSLKHGDGVLLLWVWLSPDQTVLAVKTRGFGVPAFSLVAW
jgi:hypothetical protein